MSKQPLNPPSAVLPRGMAPKDPDAEKGGTSVPRPVRYPTKEFYEDFYYICYKQGFSCNSILIGYAKQHIQDNVKLLELRDNTKKPL